MTIETVKRLRVEFGLPRYAQEGDSQLDAMKYMMKLMTKKKED